MRDNRPRFCGAKMIYSPYRGDSLPQIKKALGTMVRKFIIGRHFTIYDSLFFLTIQLIQPLNIRQKTLGFHLVIVRIQAQRNLSFLKRKSILLQNFLSLTLKESQVFLVGNMVGFWALGLCEQCPPFHLSNPN